MRSEKTSLLFAIDSMSLPPSRTPGLRIGALISASLSVLLSLVVAAFVGSSVGDDYETRAFVYVSLLLWSVVGACVLLYLTRNAESRFSWGKLLLWTVSCWLWPLMVAAACLRKPEGRK